MKTTVILFLLIFATSLSAQDSRHSLQSRLNGFRAGDAIVKQQVEYKDPGQSGESVLWNFGKLTSINDNYTLTYSSRDDNRVVGTEHRTMYYYSLSGDSLLCHGYENPTTLMIYERPELSLRFPVQYGDSTFSYYSGNGKYCERLKISAMGTVSTQADAYGTMILPSGDTIRNVIRVHTVKKIAETTVPFRWGLDDVEEVYAQTVTTDSIDYRLANDSIVIELETYRWYMKGYRYPVFETVKSITNRQGKETDYFNTAFFFPPQEHDYLDDDAANLALLEEEVNTKFNDPQDNNPWLGLTYNFYPNPAVNDLTVEVFMPKAGNVRMQLTDRAGGMVWKREYGTWKEGIHAVQVSMSPFVRGNYVLNMWFDEYRVGEIVIKL